MGLFSTKKVTHVNTTVSRVIEDEFLPNAVNSAVLRSLIKNGDLGDYLIDGLLQSVGVRSDRMYTYAEQYYSNGLPSGKFNLANQGASVIEGILGALEGTPVITEYVKFGPLNPYHLAWDKLITEFGYDPVTNILELFSTATQKVYVEDLMLVVPSELTEDYLNEATQYWDIPVKTRPFPNRPEEANLLSNVFPPPIVRIQTGISDISIVVNCLSVTPSNGHFINLTKSTFSFTLPDMSSDADYFQAKYVVDGVTKYWQYLFGSNTEPTIENIFNSTSAEAGTFFPFTYFRYDKTVASTDPLDPEYITSKKMLNYLGMDYTSMVEEINDNPDIADVEQAMLMFAVPANTTELIEQRYLFDFFSNVYHADIATLDTVTKVGVWGSINTVGKYSVVIQDNKFKMAITAADIKRNIKKGNIGSYASEYSTVTETVVVEDIYDPFNPAYVTNSIVVSVHKYQKQLTPDFYEEFEVRGLITTFWVFGEYTVIGDELDPILLIPLDHSITTQYSITDRETIYSRAIHLVFNSRVIEKIKWYQTGLFKALMIVVAIVIAVASWGTQLQWLGAALSVGAYAIAMQIVVILLEQLLVGMLVAEAFSLFVKEIGIDVAYVMAVIAAAYGMYTRIGTVGVQQAVWGERLLAASTGLFKGVSNTTAALMEDLLAQYSEFDLYMKEQLETLEDAEALLHQNVVLNPFDLLPEMTPDQYYKLASHSGNIGPSVGMAATTYYVDNALRLPKFSDTIGGKKYG